MPPADGSQQPAKQPRSRRIEDQPRLARAEVCILDPVRIDDTCMPRARDFHPRKQVEIEIVAARIASHDQRSDRQQRGATDQEGFEAVKKTSIENFH